MNQNFIPFLLSYNILFIRYNTNFLNSQILTIMVKITIHHNVFAQSLSVSTKIAQLHVYHQVLYLAGERGHRLWGPPPQFSPRCEVCHTAAYFPLWLWLLVQASRGTRQKRNSSGEKISLINIRHLGESRSPLNPSLCCSAQSLGGKMGRKEDPTEHLSVGP